MKMIMVVSVGVRAQNSCEPFASACTHSPEEGLLVMRPMPSPLDRDLTSISKKKGRHIERVRQAMFGYLGPSDPVPRPARIGRDHSHLHHRRTQVPKRSRRYPITHPIIHGVDHWASQDSRWPEGNPSIICRGHLERADGSASSRATKPRDRRQESGLLHSSGSQAGALAGIAPSRLFRHRRGTGTTSTTCHQQCQRQKHPSAVNDAWNSPHAGTLGRPI